MGSWFIYGLRLPGGPIRYVGSTQATISQRLDAHRQLARNRPRTKLHKWMAKVGPYRVEAVLLEEVPDGDTGNLDATEIEWISRTGQKHRLLNMTSGGSGRSHDPDAQASRRQKLSGPNHANFGKPLPATTRARISAALKARAAAGLRIGGELTARGRQVRSERAVLTNHNRWHAARGTTSPDCHHCPDT